MHFMPIGRSLGSVGKFQLMALLSADATGSPGKLAFVNFHARDLEIPGAKLLTPQIHRDDRGWFMESYRRSSLAAVGIDTEFVQDNRSFSKRGVLRGLHFHAPGYEQSKLVQVVSGEIFDVIVDLRRDSLAFGKWLSVRLDDLTAQLLFVPRGCAHGFQVLSEGALVTYKVDREYDGAAERSLAWNTPELAIPWPIQPPELSERDAEAAGWRAAVDERA